MLAWLKTNAAKARDTLSTEVAKFKNQKFMDATTAGCAIVAAADNDISAAEKSKMIGFITHSPELKVFELKDVINSFNDHCTKFEFDLSIGRAEALKVVGKLKGNDGAARLLVRVVCSVGASDGNFDDQEKAACRSICLELGLDPADFEL